MSSWMYRHDFIIIPLIDLLSLALANFELFVSTHVPLFLSELHGSQ